MDERSPTDPQRTYVEMLAGAGAPGRFLDVRWRAPGARMRRRFVASTAVPEALRLLAGAAVRSDVYVGVALRDSDVHGGRAAISHGRLLWVESDDPGTAERLVDFPHAPTMVIASGTPGHLQLYWRLTAPSAIAGIESANRRLALALGGDPCCAEGARILRPPDTLNHKHDPPRAVTLLRHTPDAAFALTQLLHGLPEDPEPPAGRRPISPRRAVRTDLDRALLAIPAADYALALAGRAANREGKLLCPFHDDTRPSLQLYADGGFYCFGSGCRRGGTIFDFAGHMWGIPPRGVGFLELRLRLSEAFGLESDRCG